MASVNLQRNSKVFLSSVDLTTSAATAMTPINTIQIEVLAGMAVSQATSTQDITTLESGENPDRSQQRFKTALNPVDWSFETYIRPTGVTTGAVQNTKTTSGSLAHGYILPLCDSYLWQLLTSNTAPGTGANVADANVHSVWRTNGVLETSNVAAGVGMDSSRTNFGRSSETNLYFVLDDVIYHVNKAIVNQATVDGTLDDIGKVTWSGFGSTMTELTDTPNGPAVNNTRAKAISVFGGTPTGGGTRVAANATSNAYLSAHFQEWGTANVSNGTDYTPIVSGFVTNRLTTMTINYTPTDGGTKELYTFPITGCSVEYNNGVTYLTPEELGALNSPIGSFAGSRQVSGSITMYLKAADTGDGNQSADFLRDLQSDTRTASSGTTDMTLTLGGATYNRLEMTFPAPEFAFPETSVEDVISMTATFVGQEPTATKGSGGEIRLQATLVDAGS